MDAQSKVNFVICFHNHQPVDNFDHVFAHAYEDAYKPFLDVIERFPKVKFCAHYSGPLLEWMQKNRLDIFMRLQKLVEAKRLELLGGGFYEPIFSMLPERDVLGQIEMMNEFIKEHFGVRPQGVWLSERIWEPALVSTLAKAEMSYTVLDDSHFKAVGLADKELVGYCLTEHQGALFKLFPLKEDLRYSIPFKDPPWTMDYLKSFARKGAGGRTPLVVYADDGEKFGSWPHTKKHVYDNGWLERFFTLLSEQSDVIETITFEEALQRERPVQTVYLPTISYREMGEWAMLPPAQQDFVDFQTRLKEEQKWERMKHFLPGGQWNNFRVKYPEANLMYGRMLSVSEKVAHMNRRGAAVQKAQRELYQAQCNCAYWHGVFGGIYMPHLRRSVYRRLMAAEEMAELERTRVLPSLGYEELDVNLDGDAEVRLYNEWLNLFLAPQKGGALIECDVLERQLNLSSILSRRPEAYHKELSASESLKGEKQVKSVHEANAPSPQDLKKLLVYDPYPRASLLDHFFEPHVDLETLAGMKYSEQGTFVHSRYESHTVKKQDVVVVTLKCQGSVAQQPCGAPLALQKEIRLPSAEAGFTVTYTLHNPGRDPLNLSFGVEWVLSLLTPESTCHQGDKKRQSSFAEAKEYMIPQTFYVYDPWQKLDIRFTFSTPPKVYVLPIHTVSQSEGGFEAIYQGSVVLPRWDVTLAPEGAWSVVMTQRFTSD